MIDPLSLKLDREEVARTVEAVSFISSALSQPLVNNSISYLEWITDSCRVTLHKPYTKITKIEVEIQPGQLLALHAQRLTIYAICGWADRNGFELTVDGV